MMRPEALQIMGVNLSQKGLKRIQGTQKKIECRETSAALGSLKRTKQV